MAEFGAMRDMDEFLIHPVKIKMDYDPHHWRQSSFADESTPIVSPNEVLAIKDARRAPEPVRANRKLEHELVASRGYMSDEEAPSPTDNDDSGFGFSSSETESTPSLRETPSLEDLPESAFAVQLCSQAQAVHVVVAGRAKVVSVPRLVDVPSAQRFVKPVASYAVKTGSETNNVNFSRPRQAYRDARNESHPANEKSPISPTPSPILEQSFDTRVIRRKPSLRPLQVIPRFNSSRSEPPLCAQPLSAQRADFTKHRPSSPVSRSSSKSITQKLSSTFSLKAKGKSRRPGSESNSSNGDEWEYMRRPELAAESPTISDFRTTLAPKAKMVPRGAGERTAPIMLPPCPRDYTATWDARYPPQWPLAKASTAAPPTFDPTGNTPTKHSRRRSLSAAMVRAHA